ncbi:MAG TPA: putative baseplate assembly protein, partial [Ktedonobacteraceae bacterium]
MINEPISLTPEIDYLSKDYASFRQLMLDHLAARVPTWKEPSEADIGNVIVELMAYAADYLSYYQDAVATEAYLGTARRRTSIKRHVRLLDYVLHEGCNARVWVYLEVSRDTTLPPSTPLLTRIGELVNVPVISTGSPAYNDAMDQQLTVFETMYAGQLFVAHNTIDFFVQDGQNAMLPEGSTSAQLRAPEVNLKVGQALLLEEIRGTETGDVLDADTSHRHIVRLTRVTPGLVG